MRKLLILLVALLLGGGAIGLWVTAPDTLAEDRLAGLAGDAARGETVFTAAGCASCHHAPQSEDKLVLAGGQAFASDFGTFYAPNISPSPAGLDGWTQQEFANAVLRGVSPAGQHYYPAFPYTAYLHMTDQDLVDLWAYMQSLPPSDVASKPHEVGFPFNIRRSVGGWKFLFLDASYVMDAPDAELARGRYLVEALAHCAECHTPRNALGALDRSRWLRGAPNPTGRGTIPGLAPDQLDWAASDIAYYLETGFTPDFDSAGGHMVAVVENFAKLPAEDRAAVAAYLKALP